MKSQILSRLQRIERENDISVIYACESGSRAWGFSRPDSDYDVRFIYKSNNPREYVSLGEKGEVIESVGKDLDIVGWDIKKALKLHRNGNPNLREWILSPIVYVDWKADIFRDLPDFDRAKLKFHYTNIATSNWKVLKDNPEPSKRIIKMYLYNSRCVLVWMIINEAKDPLINIHDLLNQADSLDGDIKADINALVSYYRSGCEGDLDLGLISGINRWMGEHIQLMRKDFPKTHEKADLRIYDDRLFDIIFPDYD